MSGFRTIGGGLFFGDGYQRMRDTLKRCQSRCPLCGYSGALALFTSVSCPNPGCRNWDRKQFPEPC